MLPSGICASDGTSPAFTPFVAKRVNLSKLLQEIRGFAELGNRRPHPASIWGMPRPLQIKLSPVRRRLVVFCPTQDDRESEVKITQILTD
jgi:hypothetical protein